jgi:ParB-like chromosome segregation protein Spo0J
MNHKIEKLPVASIRVSKSCRRLVDEKVGVLAKSMAEIGLKTPISVRLKKRGPIAVTGHHRLEAAKRLKWKKIDCFIINGDKVDAQLWTIAENLHRAELDAIQRADLIEAWKHLLKDREKGAQVAQPGGHQPHDKGVSATAKALATSRDDVRRAGVIANISSEAKAAAKAGGLGDNKAALLKIGKAVGVRAQMKKVRELVEHKTKPHGDLSRTDKRHLRRLTELFNAARELKSAWACASKTVREKFVSLILKPAR